MNPTMKQDHENGFGYSNMMRTFMLTGLQPPLVPMPLRQKITVQEEWCWGTRPVSPFEMYMMSRGYVSELLSGIEDHVAIAHAGHGLNSYGLQFTLMFGPVVLILQNSFGGVYNDKSQSCRAISKTYNHVRKLLHMIPQSVRDGMGNQRIVIMFSDFRGICQCLVQDDVMRDTGRNRPFDAFPAETHGEPHSNGMEKFSVGEKGRSLHGWQEFCSQADLFKTAKKQLRHILKEA